MQNAIKKINQICSPIIKKYLNKLTTVKRLAKEQNYTLQPVASLRMMTPGAEFRGVILHRLYFKECIVCNVY